MRESAAGHIWGQCDRHQGGALTHWDCIPWCTTQDFLRYWEFDCSCTSQFHGYLNTLGSSVVFFKQSWRSLCNVVGSYQETTPPFGSSTAERSLIQFGGGLYSISHSNSRLKVRSVLMWWPYKREKPQWSLWVSACQGERKNIFYIKTRLRKE